MNHRCDLCGEFFESGRLFVSAQASACNDCISNLIDAEADRRGNADDATVAGGQSGDARLSQLQIEAQQIRRG